MNLEMEQEVELAKEMFLRHTSTGQDVQPMARIDGPGAGIIAILDIEGMSKWVVLAKLARENEASRVVFMADTWMRRLDTPEAIAEWDRSTKQVRDYDDKYEALVVTIIEPKGIETVVMPYQRVRGEIEWRPDWSPGPHGEYLSKGAELVQAVLL